MRLQVSVSDYCTPCSRLRADISSLVAEGKLGVRLFEFVVQHRRREWVFPAAVNYACEALHAVQTTLVFYTLEAESRIRGTMSERRIYSPEGLYAA